ncbi:MAG: PAS domain-containing protein, partial [Candidatus Poribacteria bacterium]|nr:PAS domain-containing protein [Candidatus Poribacteria bacterium]
PMSTVTAHKPSSDGASTQRHRILIAEDEDEILSAYAFILSENSSDASITDAEQAALETELFSDMARAKPFAGYDLCLCHQGEEAIKAAKASVFQGTPFSVAFIDMRMPPGVNGLETAKEIRAIDQDVNIVFVTGYSDFELDVIIDEVPPIDQILYCRKPLHPSELRQLAAALSAKWQGRRDLLASHKRMNYLLTSSPAILYSRPATSDQNPTYVSQNIKKLTGFDSDDFTEGRKSWWSNCHPHDAAKVMLGYQSLLSDGHATREYRFAKADGDYIWFLDEARVVYDSNRNPLEIIGCCIDITDKKNAEQAADKSAALAESIIGNSPALIDLKDADGRYVIVNEVLATYLGQPPEALVGKSMHALFPPAVCDTRMTNHAKILNENCVIQNEQTIQRDKTTRTYLVSQFPVLDQNGQPYMVGTVATDITERKKAELQLIQNAKLASLGEMSAGIAHELNQPLNIIRMAVGSCSLMMEEGDTSPAEIPDHLKIIEEQCLRAADIITHMMLFGRKDEGTKILFDPSDSARNAIQLSAAQFRVDGVTISADIPDTVGMVCGYQLRLEQVLINLMNNARDAIAKNRHERHDAKGVEKGKINLQVARDSGTGIVCISIEDNGGGVAEEDLQRIFDPFMTTKEQAKGTGLGLSISYGIVTEMGGTINAENTEKGVRFVIQLPLTQEAGNVLLTESVA